MPLESKEIIQFESSLSQNDISKFRLKNEIRSFLSQRLNYPLIIGPIQTITGANYYADVYLGGYGSNESIVMIGKLQYFDYKINNSTNIIITDVLSRYQRQYQVYFNKYHEYLEYQEKIMNDARIEFEKLMNDDK